MKGVWVVCARPFGRVCRCESVSDALICLRGILGNSGASAEWFVGSRCVVSARGSVDEVIHALSQVAQGVEGLV